MKKWRRGSEAQGRRGRAERLKMIRWIILAKEPVCRGGVQRRGAEVWGRRGFEVEDL